MGRKRKAETEIEEEQHKAEENNIMSKGRKRNWGLLLPKNGILGPDGNPFYHHSVANLRKQHYQRIEECGIRLVHGKFTSTEDRRIRKNWRRFAREQNLKDEDVWKFLPAKHRRAALGDCRRLCSMERMIFEQDFWCKMCRKMDGRIGRQIQTRMCLIFNPFYLSGEASRPWTNADDEKLVDLMQIYGKDCPLLAFKLHRTVTVVEKKVEALLNNKAPALIPHGDRLLDCVCRVAGLSNIFSGIAENFDFSTLNWDEVAKLMDSNEDASILRETFFKKRLPKSVDLFKRSDGGCRKAMKSLTRRDKFSVRAEAIAVIPLLMEHSAKALKDINFEKLKEQLVESGYLRNRVEAAEKCPVITHRIGRQINKLSEKRLHMQLTFNEKLRVLLEIYEDPAYSPRKHSVLALEKATSLFQAIDRKIV